MDYKKVYSSIIEVARNRVTESYVERHHIVPRCIGGNNLRKNIVQVSAREHYILHKLLVEMYKDKPCLKVALWGMSNQLTSKNNERNYTVSSREYERARILFSESMKGRKCTWGAKISMSKKGKPQKKRSLESIQKMKETIRNSPYRHSEEMKQNISMRMKNTVKSEEWKLNISNTLKRKGIKPPSRRKQVVVEGVTYTSMKEACESLGVCMNRLKKLILN